MDEERWMPVKGYEGLYAVSNMGRVWSSYNNSILKPTLHKTGYYYIMLTRDGVGRQFRLHRLVAEAFCPNDNPEENDIVNHKDENKANNRADNLEWCTTKYNINYGTCIERRKAALEKEVLCINFNGDIVARYKSVAEANRALGKPESDTQICRVCNGKLRVAFNRKWKYASDVCR